MGLSGRRPVRTGSEWANHDMTFFFTMKPTYVSSVRKGGFAGESSSLNEIKTSKQTT